MMGPKIVQVLNVILALVGGFFLVYTGSRLFGIGLDIHSLELIFVLICAGASVGLGIGVFFGIHMMTPPKQKPEEPPKNFYEDDESLKRLDKRILPKPKDEDTPLL